MSQAPQKLSRFIFCIDLYIDFLADIQCTFHSYTLTWLGFDNFLYYFIIGLINITYNIICHEYFGFTNLKYKCWLLEYNSWWYRQIWDKWTITYPQWSRLIWTFRSKTSKLISTNKKCLYRTCFIYIIEKSKGTQSMKVPVSKELL